MNENKTPLDLRDTQPMETLNEGQRFAKGCMLGTLISTLMWAAIIVVLLMVFG